MLRQGRDWSDVSESQGAPNTDGSCHKLRESMGVYSSFIHNYQNLGLTKMSFNKRMHK